MNFTPDADLAFSTKYNVTIGTGAEDLAGNNLSTDHLWNFTTAAPDNTAPTVIGNTPTGTDVPVTTIITVTFNESMNQTSVENAFDIDPSVNGTFTWSGDTMNFISDADLASSTKYNVTIVTGAEDLAGNNLSTDHLWNFTTAAPDNTPPTVIGNTPTGTDVPVTTIITVTFNESMNQTSVENAFDIDPSVNGTFTWSGDTMNFTPDADLAFSTKYNVTIGTGAEDLAGNNLSTDHLWNFTTAAPDNTAPTVIGNTPTGTDVPVTTIITVTFNESMNQTSVENAFDIDPSVNGTFTWSGDTMNFISDADLASSTKYNVTIVTGAEDLAGNNLSTDHLWNFTTAAPDNTPPTVIGNTPTGTDVPVTTIITVTFNESMNQTSVENAFDIDPSVNGTFTWSGDTMNFISDADLASSTKYNVTIGTGAEDLAGNNLTTEHSWQFTTEVVTPSINVIQNPGFESGTSPWIFYTNGIGTFLNDASGVGSPHAGHITISQEGTNVQLYQPGLVLEPNTLYRLSFKAYSNTGHDFSISLHKHESPYTNYGLSDYVVNLGTSWSEYSTQFTTSGFSGTVNDGRLRFWLSPYDAIGDQYFIDDVILEKV